MTECAFVTLLVKKNDKPKACQMRNVYQVCLPVGFLLFVTVPSWYFIVDASRAVLAENQSCTSLHVMKYRRAGGAANYFEKKIRSKREEKMSNKK